MINRILKVVTIGTAVSAAPLTMKGAKIAPNDALCLPTAGTCCVSSGDVCEVGGFKHPGYYYQPAGKCT